MIKNFNEFLNEDIGDEAYKKRQLAMVTHCCVKFIPKLDNRHETSDDWMVNKLARIRKTFVDETKYHVEFLEDDGSFGFAYNTDKEGVDNYFKPITDTILKSRKFGI
jgi:hypothetical protein